MSEIRIYRNVGAKLMDRLCGTLYLAGRQDYPRGDFGYGWTRAGAVRALRRLERAEQKKHEKALREYGEYPKYGKLLVEKRSG